MEVIIIVQQRQVIDLFLASPGDLSEERETSKQVIKEVNTTLANELNLQVNLEVWEDTPPAPGRPQEIVNKYVDQCDLFVGLLWKRWGESPGDDVEFSSGFEEEFQRAKSRYEETGEPLIWLFFKNISEEIKKDPGDQLDKVLKFRDQQRKTKNLNSRSMSSDRVL